MKCYDVRRKLSAVLDGAAEGDLRDAVARHLGGCPACRAELEALASVDDAVVRAVRAGDEAPAGYFDNLWRRLEPQLGPDPEMDEIKKLAAEIVEESARRPAAVTAPAATSPGQVVLPAVRPARRGPWVAVGGALVAMVILFLVWPRLRYERVQAPPSTGPEPPPVEVVTKTKPKEEPLVAVQKEEAPAAPPPLERKSAIHKDEAPAAAPLATPESGQPKAEEILAPPKAAEPAAPVLETLGHEQIDRGMKQIAPKVKACFDLYGIVGRVMVKVRIQPDGSVGAADVEGQPSDGGECVVGAVREASFPPFRGPPMTIRYPFQAE